MTMFFSKNSYCDLDLGPRTLKLKLVQDIVIINFYVIVNQNWSINKGSKMMTKFFLKIVTATLTLTLSR